MTVRSAGIRLSALVVVLALLGAAAAALASSETLIRSARSATLGPILEGPSRHTLYVFVRGTSSTGSAHKSPYWPPLIASGRVVAARGSHVRRSRLSTDRLSDGERQVTYYGQPLYLSKRDHKPGQTRGERRRQGDGAWFVVSVSGRPVPPPGP